MKRYEIWNAKVRFEGSYDIKVRPVLIWNDTAFLITAYKMTGTDRGDNKEEFRIEHWAEAGLDKPTSIRIRKILPLKQSDLIDKRGDLDPRDILRFEIRTSM